MNNSFTNKMWVSIFIFDMRWWSYKRWKTETMEVLMRHAGAIWWKKWSRWMNRRRGKGAVFGMNTTYKSCFSFVFDCGRAHVCKIKNSYLIAKGIDVDLYPFEVFHEVLRQKRNMLRSQKKVQNVVTKILS